MKKLYGDWGLVGILVVAAWFLASLLQSQDAYAAWKKVSGTGKVVTIRSQTKTLPGDVPNHEVTITRRLDVWSSADPDWNNVPASFVAYADYIAGTGPSWGYIIVAHPGGDQTHIAYEGMTKTVMNPDGSWEATFSGRHWIIGGTGRFRGITGSGTYRGKATPEEVTYEWEAEYEIR